MTRFESLMTLFHAFEKVDLLNLDYIISEIAAELALDYKKLRKGAK